MSKLTGFKTVAIINQGYKDYYYALYDENIKIGDDVLVTGTACDSVWTVKDIKLKDDVDIRQSITAEVICKVDTSKYDQRVKNRKAAENIKLEMDKKIKEMQETDKYEMYADKNPELAELLKAYKALV